MSESPSMRMDRRTAIKWMMAASAALAFPRRGLAEASTVHAAAAFAKGYGTDPDLLKSYNPADIWPLTFSAQQRQLAAVLCDTIIPADEHSPAASTVGVHDFIDEWISAPYPDQQADRPLILDGLTWIDAESQRRFGLGFVNAIGRQRRMICDDLCHAPDAKPEFEAAARFFARFRDLTAGGFYTTPEGMKDLKYVGNVALQSFDGPPAELIRKLGLE